MPSPLNPGKYVAFDRGGKSRRLERGADVVVQDYDDDGNLVNITLAPVTLKVNGQVAFTTNRPASEVQDILDRMEADGWGETGTGDV